MEIIPGIYSLRLPYPTTPFGDVKLGESLIRTNAYLISGTNGWLLIDAGWDDPEALEAYKSAFREIGIDFKDISQIVITHAHLDHFGLTSRLKKLSGATLAIHRLERRFIEPRSIKTEPILQQMKDWLFRNGNPDEETIKLQRLPEGEVNFLSPVYPDAVHFTGKLGVPDTFFAGGETINTGLFELEVIWTPGHSPGHICLYERTKKILFSGDHILPVITPEIGFTPFSSANPLGDYIESLERLKELEAELVLPGHGDHFFDLQKRIDELLDHHENRKQDAMRVLKNGPEVAYNIAINIPWMPERGGVPWEKIDRWGHRMALMEALAHLKLLQEEGKVTKIHEGGLEFYKLC